MKVEGEMSGVPRMRTYKDFTLTKTGCAEKCAVMNERVGEWRSISSSAESMRIMMSPPTANNSSPVTTRHPVTFTSRHM